MSTSTLGAIDFETAFRTLFPRAQRVAFRILGDETDAEDAAAEAFARAHASWKRVSNLPYRDAWVLRVTANVAIDMVRKRRTVPATDGVIEYEDGTVVHLALIAALGALPRRQRQVIALRFLAGLNEAEIAGTLRVSAGTVKKAAHRALIALRQQLGSEWRDGLDAEPYKGWF